MAIPSYETIMLPLLKFMSDRKEHSLREAIDYLSNEFKLTQEERSTLLPSGQQYTFDSRVGWARTYMKMAGLLESPKRTIIKITDRGLKVLSEKPPSIDSKFLTQFKEFNDFRARSRKVATEETDLELPGISESNTPEELLQESYESIRANLVGDILESIGNCSPKFFERLVVELLVEMGYGGSLQDAGKAVGQSHDGGIDGLIKEDKLGLDTVYIQAKRWQNTVGRPEIQRFVGALQGCRAHKGVFITTSDFTKDAVEYANQIDSKIALIDGKKLAEYMIDFDIGVSKVSSYEIKRIDSDYFIED